MTDGSAALLLPYYVVAATKNEAPLSCGGDYYAPRDARPRRVPSPCCCCCCCFNVVGGLPPAGGGMGTRTVSSIMMRPRQTAISRPSTAASDPMPRISSPARRAVTLALSLPPSSAPAPCTTT